MKTLRIILRFFFANRFFDALLELLIYSTGRNPLLFALNLNGISNWKNDTVSGERYFVKNFLPEYYSKSKTKLCFFDVGANIGNYSLLLQKYIPDATIYAFEPNQTTFNHLLSSTKLFPNILPFMIGFSNENITSKIYSYQSEIASEHASLYKNVISEIHHNKDVISIDIILEKLDDFCQNNNISQINFLKIDTEGHELSVFEGAKKFIQKSLIDIIQFEFNEMNVISRTFLKDFYDIAGDNYDFYRLNSNKLIPLNSYNTINEIFQFQNIILIKKA